MTLSVSNNHLSLKTNQAFTVTLQNLVCLQRFTVRKSHQKTTLQNVLKRPTLQFPPTARVSLYQRLHKAVFMIPPVLGELPRLPVFILQRLSRSVCEGCAGSIGAGLVFSSGDRRLCIDTTRHCYRIEALWASWVFFVAMNCDCSIDRWCMWVDGQMQGDNFVPMSHHLHPSLHKSHCWACTLSV